MGADIQAMSGVAIPDSRGTPAGWVADPKPAEVKQPKRAAVSSPPSPVPAEAVRSTESVGLVFEIKPHSHEVVVKVVDRNTQKVIREIPPEEIQRLQTTLDELVGRFVDHTG